MLTDIQSLFLLNIPHFLCNVLILPFALFKLMQDLHSFTHALILKGEFIDSLVKLFVLKHSQHSPVIIHITQHQQQVHRLVKQGTHLRFVLVNDLFQRQNNPQLHQSPIPILAIALHQFLKNMKAKVTFFALHHCWVCPNMKKPVAMVGRSNGQQLLGTDELTTSQDRVCLESSKYFDLLVIFAGFYQELREHEAIQVFLYFQLPIKDCLLKGYPHIKQMNVK